jgi:hypothetical protein
MLMYTLSSSSLVCGMPASFITASSRPWSCRMNGNVDTYGVTNSAGTVRSACAKKNAVLEARDGMLTTVSSFSASIAAGTRNLCSR